MSDLIDRQSAIDALNSLKKFSLIDSNDYLHGVGVRLKFAIQRIEQLPSAQPEIIRCRNCVKQKYCRTASVWAVAPSDDWFCADAERRTNE